MEGVNRVPLSKSLVGLIAHGNEVSVPPTISVKVSKPRRVVRVWNVLCKCFTCATTSVQVPINSPNFPLLPALSLSSNNKKTLVLDLDETLVHSSMTPVPNPDFQLKVFVEDEEVTIDVLVRPGLSHLLETCHEDYEIVVYTASLSHYADPLIDLIDPLNLVDARLYREHCQVYNGAYFKNLSRLGRDLRKVVIVDVTSTQNNPSSYIFHAENAIPIQSFIEDKEDVELYRVTRTLMELADCEDVRKVLMTAPKLSI